MKLIVLIGILATAALGVSAQSCFTYDGSQCTTVFGQANISLGSADFVFLLDREIYQIINFLSITYDQSCLNHNRLIWCMVAYFPCTGSAWCGSNSKDELKIAVASACMCNNPDSCNINGFNISSLIDISLHNYYQGSSTTGAVGSNYTMCQDVTSGSSAGNIKVSLMGVALVAILFSTGLLL